MRKVRRVADAAQKALHPASPVLVLDLDRRLQFAQVVRIAQRMQHTGHRVVGLPVIMHDYAADLRQQAAPRDFASSDGHMVEDVGENAHVQHCIPHGVANGVLARDDADGVERHALERSAIARAVVAPHE